jgi:EF hand
MHRIRRPWVKNGKISEAEFMEFMKAEFKRLDVDGSGELDVKELKKSQLRPATFLSAGK